MEIGGKDGNWKFWKEKRVEKALKFSWKTYQHLTLVNLTPCAIKQIGDADPLGNPATVSLFHSGI